ncbi:MAG: NAD(P)-dependent alcohol dehydrogenase [Bacteroidetes bacterium]|nr:NAD(P)-dependent alcohol dehydrogenase [Bacteroidota bacterium]
MKAAVYTKYGSPDNLELQEVDKPTPEDNEVLVKMHAASINSWDWDLLIGAFQARIGAFRKPKFKILGCDIAGRVEAVGSNAKQFQLGDEVFGDISGFRARDFGGFAEYVCAREDLLALKSPSMTFEQAAAIPQAGVMALQGIRNKVQLQSGDKVMINGAGGGVGTFAIQLAKSYGAEVTGVDKTEKLEMMRSIGADHVIDYTQEDFTKSGQRYDLIFDVTQHRSIFDYKRALGPKGIYAVAGGTTPRILQTVFFGPFISLLGRKKMDLMMHIPNKKDLNTMKELFEADKVAPVIDRSYTLSEAHEAFRYFGEGNFKGKVIITM